MGFSVLRMSSNYLNYLFKEENKVTRINYSYESFSSKSLSGPAFQLSKIHILFPFERVGPTPILIILKSINYAHFILDL